MIESDDFVAEFLDSLGFVLAIDNCRRNCFHCPAYGSDRPVDRANFHVLTDRLMSIQKARRKLALAAPTIETVHCWRISDPLDYVARLDGSRLATAGDLASLWMTTLNQGLYVVTNGSEGRASARAALTQFVKQPENLSQIKLTITPCDQSWNTDKYIVDLAEDIRIVRPLWSLPTTRAIRPGQRRLRLNIKTTDSSQDEALQVTHDILRRAGLSASEANETIKDSSRVSFKPIYDLGTATGSSTPVSGAVNISIGSAGRSKPTPDERMRNQYGIRPDGRIFAVDMYAFREADLVRDGRPLFWDHARGNISDSPGMVNAHVD